MGPRYMDYPSPRGVHVPQTYDDEDDPYRRDSAAASVLSPPRRNRYSRSVHQTPRTQQDVTWISSSDRQAPHDAMPVPSSPGRPVTPRTIPPSPAPTVGEHMTVDDVVFMPEAFVEPYRPQRRGSRGGLIKSIWNGLKKFSGLQPMPMPMPRMSIPMPDPYVPRTDSYDSQVMEVPVPSDGTQSQSQSQKSQYVNPTPPEMDEQHDEMPYASSYVRPPHLGATPAGILRSLRSSPVPAPASISIPIAMPAPQRSPAGEPPPITVTIVSPSIPSSPPPESTRRMQSGSGANNMLSARMPEPVPRVAEEGSQTLHEPVFPEPIGPLVEANNAMVHKPHAYNAPSSRGSGSLLRRFVAGFESLPWVCEDQIADQYIPEQNPRSRMRRKMRQGADPSWYNRRPEVEEKPEYWAQWDMWAKQSAAVLWEDTRAAEWEPGRLGMGMPTYPGGYVPAQPGGFVYPSGYPPPGVVGDAGRVMPVIP